MQTYTIEKNKIRPQLRHFERLEWLLKAIGYDDPENVNMLEYAIWVNNSDDSLRKICAKMISELEWSYLPEYEEI